MGRVGRASDLQPIADALIARGTIYGDQVVEIIVAHPPVEVHTNAPVAWSPLIDALTDDASGR